jgi:hypothetical protein
MITDLRNELTNTRCIYLQTIKKQDAETFNHHFYKPFMNGCSRGGR